MQRRPGVLTVTMGVVVVQLEGVKLRGGETRIVGDRGGVGSLE